MRRRTSSSRSRVVPLSLIINAGSLSHCFGPTPTFHGSFLKRSHLSGFRISEKFVSFTLDMIYAPPGSGYYRPEDETGYLPQTYDPMMEYPGTMRPGRTKENQPYSSLPIADTDPDPVPWPHFQEIEWHHQWTPPHEHPIPMEDFIEMEGRWATAEMEAEMRVGARRGVRERREMEEMQKLSSNFILDDDDDDDDEDDDDEERNSPSIGDGIELMIGSKASKSLSTNGSKKRKTVSTKSSSEFTDSEDDEDDFLLDLGLGDDDIDATIKGSKAKPRDLGKGDESDKSISATMISDESSLDMKFDDFDLDFSDEGGDAEDTSLNIAGDMDLDGFVGNEDIGNDNYDDDDGGYDYGFNYDDNDGGGSDNFS